MRTHRIRSALLVALLWIIASTALTVQAAPAPAPQAVPGDLDPSFAGFGTRGLVVPAGLRGINDITLQPDGKVVVVGIAQKAGDPAVYRYLPNGQLDSAFDDDGKALMPGPFVPTEVAVASDGRIVLGGDKDDDFQLARLTADGAPDTTFDDDGWVEDFDDELKYLRAILVQPDNLIVACGAAEVGGDFDFGVTRYNADGSRDTTFGGDGKVTIPFGEHDGCYDVAQQPDGKLVVAGNRSGGDLFGDTNFAVARLHPAGTLDKSFASDGTRTTDFGNDEGVATVAVQPDGKIVVLGPSFAPDAGHMARYLPNGELDTTFDDDGKLTIPVDALRSLVLQPDGKLLALGKYDAPDGGQQFALHRLLPNGDHDPTFNGGGFARFDFGGKDAGKVLALLPDGRILAAGEGTNIGLLARLWPDGTPDNGGKQTHARIAGLDQVARALAVQPDGKLLVTGELRTSTFASDPFVTRFQADGQVDISFGSLGTVRVPPGVSALDLRSTRAIAVQPDGKIVAAGYASGGATLTDFLVLRWNSDGTPDPTFNTTGAQLVDFAGNVDYGTALALAPDGKIVVVGNFWNGAGFAWGILRLTATGQPDPTFGTNGKASVDFNGSNAATAVVMQPDGKIIIGGRANDDFFLQRLLVNGARDASFGINGGGYNFTDVGGTDSIQALALAPDGWLYAAGSTTRDGGKIALAQYRPDGSLAVCQSGQPCTHWPNGTRVVGLGNAAAAYGLLLRTDNQVVAAGCADDRMVAVQVSTADVNSPPLPFQADFAGNGDCAVGVRFSDAKQDKLVLAGQATNGTTLLALARFATDRPPPTATPRPSSTPVPSPTLPPGTTVTATTSTSNTPSPTLPPGATPSPTLPPGTTPLPTAPTTSTPSPTLPPGTTPSATLPPGTTATPSTPPGSTPSPTLPPGTTVTPTPPQGSQRIYLPLVRR